MKKLSQLTPNGTDFGNAFGSPFGKEGGPGLGNLVSIILTISLTIGGIIVLFLFILGGIQIISSAGQNDPQGAAKGKQAITSAVIGFAIIFTAYWIIKVVEIITNTRFITDPGVIFQG